MDVQTQVMDQNQVPEVLIIEQTKLEDFKKSLADVRTIRISIVQEIDTLSGNIDQMIGTRDEVVSMFKSEAVSMYPEIQGADIGNLLSQLSNAHPLKLLWDQYAIKIDGVSVSIQNLITELQEKQMAEIAVAQQEGQILNAYADFRKYAVTPLPTMEQILSQLQQVEVIPYAEESSTNVSISMLEKLNPEAAALVILETANATQSPSEGDPSDEDEQTKTQMQSMMYNSGMDERQGLTESEAYADGASLMSADQLAQPNMRKFGMGLAFLTLAYMFLGGKK